MQAEALVPQPAYGYHTIQRNNKASDIKLVSLYSTIPQLYFLFKKNQIKNTLYGY